MNRRVSLKCSGNIFWRYFKVAMIILAMLIGFIALISAINALFATLFGLSFQQILGYVFYPLAWLIGIPLSDALNADEHHGHQTGR